MGVARPANHDGLFVAVALVLLTGVGRASPKSDSCELRLRISAPGTEIRYGEPFAVHASVENRSEHDVVIHRPVFLVGYDYYPTRTQWVWPPDACPFPSGKVSPGPDKQLTPPWVRLRPGQKISWVDDLTKLYFDNKSLRSCRDIVVLRYWATRDPDYWTLDPKVFPQELFCREIALSNSIEIHFHSYQEELQRKHRELDRAVDREFNNLWTCNGCYCNVAAPSGRARAPAGPWVLALLAGPLCRRRSRGR